MKVYLINTNKAWGGGEKWHLDTALALKKHGFGTAMLCAGGYELYKRSLAAGIQTIPLNIVNTSFLNLFLMRRLQLFFKNTQPDIVILNLSSDLKTAGIAAKLAGVRHIIYRRGNAKPVKNSFPNRLLFKKVITAIIANSEETRRSILANNPGLFPAANIRVLYNGIDLEGYDLAEAKPLFHTDGEQVILGSAGRLSHEKGHHLLIEAATLMKKMGIPFKLLIAGEGPEKDTLVEKCRKSGITDQVVFTGFISQIKSFMETIDIFILPSLWEGFGYVTAEAMASRKPLVAFRTGSNPEIIEEGTTGFLAECFNTQEMAEKMSVLCRDKQLRKTMGEAGRRRAEKMFSTKQTEQALLDYIRSTSET